MKDPKRLLGPENDYRGILGRDPYRSVSIAVVIPAYNRPHRLAATLAAIAGQTEPADVVVVADDGSDPPLDDAVGAFADRLPLRYVRREDDGFGAGQARNLGAEAVETDVVVFVDSDCIADPRLLERHRWWHERAPGLVVIGNRYHVEGDDVDPESVASDFDAVRALAINVPDDGRPDDWRGVFYRRNRSLQIGDSGYRAVVSSNMSIERSTFAAIGGFPDGFTSWGGEDTELGWRAWNDGAFIVADNEAVVYHQLEPGEDRASRMASLEANRLLIADRIPNRFYRTAPGPLYTVPQVSVVVRAGTADERDAHLTAVSAANYDDIELLMDADDEVATPITRVTSNTRLRTAGPSLPDTIRSARGEFVAFVDGRLAAHPRLLARAVRSFRLDPRVSAVRTSYAMEGAGTYRRLGDLADIDRRNTDGRPLFAVIRRRELMKEIHASGGIDWERLWRRVRIDLLLNDTVTADAARFDLPSRSRLPVGVGDITRAGAEESARTVVRALRSRGGRTSTTDPQPPSSSIPQRTAIRYLGWTGQDNFGDEALLQSIEGLMPWATISPSEPNPSVLMVGGGTLINSDGTYLRRLEQLDSPRLDRVVFGTGVRQPSFWGVTEPIDRWFAILESSVGVWLRGPLSEQVLREAGYTGPLQVIGDPALMLGAPEPTARREGRVLISALATGGACWGGDDAAVHGALAETIRLLRSAGHDVAFFSAHPKDDRVAIDIMRAAGHPDLEVIAGYHDVGAGISAIAAADVVVGERLHAVVLAAATHTPFVAIEYRPKVRDFADSIGAEARIVRTDEVDPAALVELIDTVSRDSDAQTAISRAVEERRAAIVDAADRLRRAIDP